MAQRVFQFTAVIPAGTPEATPATVPLDIDNWALESIDLEVPPGPAGLMGFAVVNNGVRWLPHSPDQWLVWDDVQQSWALTEQPSASGWAVQGYNTGGYDHTVIVRFHVNPVVVAVPAAAMPAVTFVTTPAAATPAVALGV